MKLPPFIILEGPDASGKTTLADALCHRLKAVMLHGASMGDSDERPCNDAIMRRYHLNLVDIARRNLALGHPVVCDRLWLSHVVYACARRPQSRHDDLLLYREFFVEKCAALGAIYVFALDDRCVDNVKAHQDPDHPRDTKSMVNLLSIYNSMFTHWTNQKISPCVRYDYTTDGMNLTTWMELHHF